MSKKNNYDLIFDYLSGKIELDMNTLFIFWDLSRCMNGEISCIDINNIVASELRYKQDVLDTACKNNYNSNEKR